MSDPEKDLFGEVPAISAEIVRALTARKCPDLIALVIIANDMARLLRPAGDGAGVASGVDAARVLGGEFTNTARRYIGAAAGLRSDVEVPPELRPDAAAIAFALRGWAAFFLARLDAVRAYLESIAEGGK